MKFDIYFGETFIILFQLINYVYNAFIETWWSRLCSSVHGYIYQYRI